MSIAALKLRIATVVAGAQTHARRLPTDIPAIDAALPNGGIPRGQLTEWLGPPGTGLTSAARQLLFATLRAGCGTSGAAWVDARRTLDPLAIAADGLDTTWVVRPPDPARAPWCADLLLRSGAFALVVLDDAPVLPRPIALRLAHLARETDTALLLLGHGTRATDGGATLRLRFDRRGPNRVPTVTPEKGGLHPHPVPLALDHVVPVTTRLCAHPEIPDRRSVARAGRRGAPHGRTRRVAQPRFPDR